MKKVILTAAIFAATMMGINAQVTIGSGASPHAGALLDLKQNNDAGVNSTKGLLLPRVALTNTFTPLPGDAATAKGMVVYNTTNGSGLTEGLYIWSGSTWLSPASNGSEINALVDLINAVDNKVGNKQYLTTTDNTNVIAGINEVNGKVGDVSTLNTSTHSSAVAGINEVNGKVGELTTTVGGLNSKVGDLTLIER